MLAVGHFGMKLGIETLRTLAFSTLVFSSQAAIYAIRGHRRVWGSRPSLWLAASSLADIAIASTLALAGFAMTPVPIWEIAAILAAAIAFAVILATVKVPIFAHFRIA